MEIVMIDMQGIFDKFMLINAAWQLERGYDLSPRQIEDLRLFYRSEQLYPNLRDYVDGYPASRKRDLRGRPRQGLTDKRDRENLLIVTSYWISRLEHREAPRSGRREKGPARRIAQQIIDALKLGINVPEALLNRVCELRYLVDTREFWRLIIDERGNDFAERLRDFLKPTGHHLRAKYESLSEGCDAAMDKVSSHLATLTTPSTFDRLMLTIPRRP